MKQRRNKEETSFIVVVLVLSERKRYADLVSAGGDAKSVRAQGNGAFLLSVTENLSSPIIFLFYSGVHAKEVVVIFETSPKYDTLLESKKTLVSHIVYFLNVTKRNLPIILTMELHGYNNREFHLIIIIIITIVFSSIFSFVFCCLIVSLGSSTGHRICRMDGRYHHRRLHH